VTLTASGRTAWKLDPHSWSLELQLPETKSRLESFKSLTYLYRYCY